jgi:hypothetical protein
MIANTPINFTSFIDMDDDAWEQHMKEIDEEITFLKEWEEDIKRREEERNLKRK